MKKGIAILLLIIMCLTSVTYSYSATMGTPCDYNDGGEMIYTGTSPWEIFLSYYDTNHEIKWMIIRYRTYVCNVNSNHTDYISETKMGISTSELAAYGIIL